MDARNLAIVFGPTLLQPKQDMLNMVKDMSDQCRIVESVILHVSRFLMDRSGLKDHGPLSEPRCRAVLGSCAFLFAAFVVGRGGALVESMPFDRMVVGSNLALAAA